MTDVKDGRDSGSAYFLANVEISPDMFDGYCQIGARKKMIMSI